MGGAHDLYGWKLTISDGGDATIEGAGILSLVCRGQLIPGMTPIP